VLYDPPKSGVEDTISHLKNLGVSMKIITGDNRLAAANLASSRAIKSTYIDRAGDTPYEHGGIVQSGKCN